MRFIVQVCSDNPDLQIMYGIGGEKKLTEQTLDHLCGYGGAKPVRIGNGAYDQRQNDVWGALLDSIYLHEKALKGTGTPADRAAGPLPGGSGDRGLAEPDQGIWESRGEPQHYVSSKLMIWVAVDRGVRLARSLGFDGDRRRSGRRRPTSSTPRSSSAASATASSASTTRPTRSTPRCC